jgi:hypothetical protein
LGISRGKMLSPSKGDEFFAAPTIPTLPTPVVAPIPQPSIQKAKDLFEPFAPLKIIGAGDVNHETFSRDARKNE